MPLEILGQYCMGDWPADRREMCCKSARGLCSVELLSEEDEGNCASRSCRCCWRIRSLAAAGTSSDLSPGLNVTNLMVRTTDQPWLERSRSTWRRNRDSSAFNVKGPFCPLKPCLKQEMADDRESASWARRRLACKRTQKSSTSAAKSARSNRRKSFWIESRAIVVKSGTQLASRSRTAGIFSLSHAHVCH